MSFEQELARAADIMVQQEFAHVPHSQCHVGRADEEGNVWVVWDGWAPSLHRGTASTQDFMAPFAGPDHDDDADMAYEKERREAVAARDIDRLVAAFRPHFKRMAASQHERARRGTALGIAMPLPSPLMLARDLVRIDHLTVDAEAARILGDAIHDRVQRGLRSMIDGADANDGRMVASDNDQEDEDIWEDEIDEHPLAPAALYEPAIVLSGNTKWIGRTIALDGPPAIPEAAALHAVGRKMRDLVRTGTELDERIIERVWIRDTVTLINVELHPVMIGSLPSPRMRN